MRECLAEAPEVDLGPFLAVLDATADPVRNRRSTAAWRRCRRCDERLLDAAVEFGRFDT